MGPLAGRIRLRTAEDDDDRQSPAARGLRPVLRRLVQGRQDGVALVGRQAPGLSAACGGVGGSPRGRGA